MICHITIAHNPEGTAPALDARTLLAQGDFAPSGSAPPACHGHRGACEAGVRRRLLAEAIGRITERQNMRASRRRWTGAITRDKTGEHGSRRIPAHFALAEVMTFQGSSGHGCWDNLQSLSAWLME